MRVVNPLETVTQAILESRGPAEGMQSYIPQQDYRPPSPFHFWNTNFGGSWLNLGSITLGGGGGCTGDCTPPTAPTLTSTGATANSITLSWSGSTDNVGVAGYRVFRGSTQIATVTGTSYTDTGLASATQYSYVVEAYDAAGNVSPASNTVTVTTSSGNSGGGASCHISYGVQSSWGTGFDAAINITNTGSTPISTWTLTWSWSGNQSLTQANGSTYSQSGPSVTLTSLSWDGSIAAGATLSGDVSIAASFSGTNSNPSVFYLNGTQCQ
jgi:cellulose 1,4-beta-cellobiosidase